MRQLEQLPRAALLNSWKEIALYLGRGVRTVQRWEHDLGLPVHRPRGRQRSAVLAFPAELDHWIQHTPVHARGSTPAHPPGEPFPVQNARQEQAQLRRELARQRHELLERVHANSQQLARLHKQLEISTYLADKNRKRFNNSGGGNSAR